MIVDRRRGRRRTRSRSSRSSIPTSTLEPSLEEIGPDDLLTLIYTSGTTGPPKGVQLTHRNLMTLVAGVDDMVDFPERGGKVISWLPSGAHRRAGRQLLPAGDAGRDGQPSAPTRARSSSSCRRCNPTFFFAVPRIWEKLKAGLEAKLGGDPRRGGRAGARRAFEAAIKKVRLEQAGEEVPDELAAGVAAADEAMFPHLRKALGLDEADSVNVGAAPDARSRCSSSSTRSASRSASSGACRRPAA